MHLLEQLLGALAPHRCISCGLEGTPLCLPCSNQLPRPPECCYKCGKRARQGLCRGCLAQSGLQTISVRTVYGGLAEQAIHALKFDRNRAIANILSECMAPICPAGFIVPVPTANRRVRQRGYDQAVLLAHGVAANSQNPCVMLLQRSGSQRQLGNNRATRAVQLRDAFQVNGKISQMDTPIILVDDVMTTGSTFEAAAAQLQQAGYRNVHALVFAWTQ